MQLQEFIIKDSERCESLGALVKRLEAGEVPPPMPKPPKRLDLRFIDSLSHAECKVVHDRVQARLSQMRTEDLLVYGIKRILGGETRYHTCVPGGWRQRLAADMEHSRLWLTARRTTADSLCKALAGDWPRNVTWEVFEMPKTDAVKLPCYTTGCNYGEDKEMTGCDT